MAERRAFFCIPLLVVLLDFGSPAAGQGGPGEYDIILEVGSVEQIIEDKQFIVNGTIDPANPEELPTKVRVFGIIGLFNKGKSWFLNRLFQTAFPYGPLATTRGISMKFVKGNDETKVGSWLVLDSAGNQATVKQKGFDTTMSEQQRRNEELNNVARVIMRESFVFDVIVQVSELIVYMVNDLSWVEQKEIYQVQYAFQKERSARAGQEGADAEADRQIVVVHNFKSVEKVSDGRALFQQQVLAKYPGQLSGFKTEEESELFFIEKEREMNTIPLRHYALLNDEKKPGYWGGRSETQLENDKVIDQIRKYLYVFGLTSDFDFKSRFAQKLASSLEKFASVDTDDKWGPSEDDESEDERAERMQRLSLRIKYDPEVTISGKYKLSKFKIMDERKLKTKFRGKFDQLNRIEIVAAANGFSIPEKVSYDVPGYGDYGCFRTVQVEVPGVREKDLYFPTMEETLAKGEGFWVLVERKLNRNFESSRIKKQIHPDPSEQEAGRSGTAIIPLTFYGSEKNWKFNPKAPPTMKCLKSVPPASRRYCKSVVIENGVLYMTALHKVGSQIQEEEEEVAASRRRQMKWF